MPNFRETLDIIHQMGENIAQGTARQNAYEKESTAKKMRAQLGQQVRDGAPMDEQYATLAEIDPKYYADLRAHMLTQQAKPQATTYDDAALDSFNLPPEKRAVAGRLKGKEQSDYLGLANTDRTGDLKEQGAALQAKAEERRMNQTVQGQRGAFIKTFDGVEKEIQNEQRAINKVNEAYKTGSVSGDSVVFNYIARNIAGEKGPLSNDDINRIAARQIGGDFQAALNFTSNNDESKLTPAQRESYAKLLKTAQDNFESYKHEKVKDIVGRAQGDYPLLYSDDSTPDKAVIQRAQKYGYEHRGGGAFEKTVSKTEHTGDYGAALSAAGKIKDEATKAAAVAKIKAFQDAKKPVPQPMLDKINAMSSSGAQ